MLNAYNPIKNELILKNLAPSLISEVLDLLYNKIEAKNYKIIVENSNIDVINSVMIFT